MSQAKDEKINNSSIRNIMFNIPTIKSQIAIRCATFVGKVMRGPNHHPPKMLMPAWVDNPRARGGQLMTVKKSFANILCTLLPKEMMELHRVKNKDTGEMEIKSRLDKTGKMSLWLKIAFDKSLWNWHIEKLKQPGINIPPPNPHRPNPTPPEQPPTPPRNSGPPRQNQRTQTPSPPPANNHRQQSPPPNPPPSPPNHSNRNYNPNEVERSKPDALRALGLPLNATEREVRSKFRRLSLVYHPDRYSSDIGMTIGEATAHFQLLNNAHEYLRSLNLG